MDDTIFLYRKLGEHQSQITQKLRSSDKTGLQICIQQVKIHNIIFSTLHK